MCGNPLNNGLSISLLKREISLHLSLPLSGCARNVGNQNVRRSDKRRFLPMQSRVIILGFNSSIHGIYVILVSALSANVTLNHLILMEKQRAMGARYVGECTCLCVCWGEGLCWWEAAWGGVVWRGLTVQSSHAYQCMRVPLRYICMFTALRHVWGSFNEA